MPARCSRRRASPSHGARRCDSGPTWSRARRSTRSSAGARRCRVSRSPCSCRRWTGARAASPWPMFPGGRAFADFTLAVDRRVLIPRPETEGLVELVLTHASRGIVADVCTGSGCIALSLADEGVLRPRPRRGPECRCARRGGRQCPPHGPGGRADPGRPDGFAGDRLGRRAGGQSAVHRAPRVRGARRLGARLGTADGAGERGGGARGHANDCCDDGRRVVVPGGWIALELDASRAAATAAVASASGWRHVTIHHDLFGRERYLLAQRSEIP